MRLIDDRTSDPMREISAILARRKWQILLIFLLVAGGVAIVTFMMPKQYTAHMKILVKTERAEMVVTTNSNSASVYPGGIGEEQINTEIELLNSRNLLEQVVVKTGLDRSTRPGARKFEPLAVEKAVALLGRQLKISPVRKASIIDVEYSGTNAHLAVTVLRQLSESYLEQHLKVHGTPGTFEFFAGQADRYRNELKEAEAKLAEFRHTNDIVMLADQEETMLHKASESEAALSQTQAAIGEYRDRIANVRKQLVGAAPRVVTQSRVVSNQYSVEHLSSMIADLQNRRTQLLAKFRPDDRMVLEAEKEIADTQVALDKAKNLNGSEQATDINPVHQTLEIDLAKEQGELAGLEAKRQTLAQQATSYHAQLVTLGNDTAAYDDLVRTRKEAEDNYLLYSKKTEEARIAESLDMQKIANVAIAETPEESHLPSKPNVPLNLSLGTLLAGFLSVGVAFGREYFERSGDGTNPPGQIEGRTDLGSPFGPRLLGTVDQASDLEKLTGLPILGTMYR